MSKDKTTEELAEVIEREYDAAATFDANAKPAPLALARVIVAAGFGRVS